MKPTANYIQTGKNWLSTIFPPPVPQLFKEVAMCTQLILQCMLDQHILTNEAVIT